MHVRLCMCACIHVHVTCVCVCVCVCVYTCVSTITIVQVIINTKMISAYCNDGLEVLLPEGHCHSDSNVVTSDIDTTVQYRTLY